MKNFFVFGMLLLTGVAASAQDTLAKPSVKIVDQPGILKPDEVAQIQVIIDHLFTAKNGNAYLLIIDSLPPGVNIMQYSKGVFKKWGLNNEGAGINFIIVYAVKNHAHHIEASDKVIQLVTKQYLRDVTTNSMNPYFRKRQDFEALKRGMDMVAKKIESNN